MGARAPAPPISAPTHPLPQMKALISLSEFYADERLSDDLLLDPELSIDMAVEYLTAVTGIGAWSANM